MTPASATAVATPTPEASEFGPDSGFGARARSVLFRVEFRTDRARADLPEYDVRIRTNTLGPGPSHRSRIGLGRPGALG
jgi:hypothetical protein